MRHCTKTASEITIQLFSFFIEKPNRSAVAISSLAQKSRCGHRWWTAELRRATIHPPRAQEMTICIIIAGGSLGPIEIGVLANHTLEMIPKSMILIGVGQIPLYCSTMWTKSLGKSHIGMSSHVLIWLKFRHCMLCTMQRRLVNKSRTSSITTINLKLSQWVFPYRLKNAREILLNTCQQQAYVRPYLTPS